LIDEKFEIFTDKEIFTKRAIESLVMHSKDTSEKIRSLSCEILMDFIAILPNYNEIVKKLNPDLLTEIYNISKNKQSENSRRIRKILNNQENPLLSKDEVNKIKDL